MHGLHCLHDGGHMYGPNGIGEREYDPAQHLTSEVIADTRDLPGFVEPGSLGNAGVTYESHHFWVHFLQYKRLVHAPLNEREAEERKTPKDSGVLIRVHHGGGWEVWRGDYMLAHALRCYGNDDRGLFKLCWYMIDAARTARTAGREETAAEYRQAFVDGRLRKRKLPAQGKVKVWIEPKEERPAPHTADSIL